MVVGVSESSLIDSGTGSSSIVSSTTLGERSGVARGSVRRINWIATSSSEITLAEVGVGVGRGCCMGISRVVVSIGILLSEPARDLLTDPAGDCGNGGISGRF
jgi:hypothetical protein